MTRLESDPTRPINTPSLTIACELIENTYFFCFFYYYFLSFILFVCLFIFFLYFKNLLSFIGISFEYSFF
jgi:hypothetical protein